MENIKTNKISLNGYWDFMPDYENSYIEKLPEKSSDLNKKKLVSVGRLSPEKGYMDLLKIYNLLHKKHPEWTLDIVGDGVEKDRMIKYIEEHNLKDFVTLHGYQTKDYI